MSKLVIVLVFGLISTHLFSQPIHDVNYLTWSNSTTFKTSPPPAISGYGALSTSLSETLGNIYYVYGNEYFIIDNWASYYYWFTQKHWYLFQNPDEYEYYYNSKNDIEMMRYLAQSYWGPRLPSKIDFEGLNLSDNIMTYAVNAEEVNELKSYIKAEYNKEEDLKYLAKRKELKIDLEKNKELENHRQDSKTQVSKKSNSSSKTKDKTERKTSKSLKKN